jgi:hypothetical protein
MRMLPSGYSPGSCEPATTPPRALAKIVCTHNGDPAGPTAATYTLCRRKSVATAAFRRSPVAQPSSRAREPFSRPYPGAATPRPSKSAARWCAAIATASRRSPGPPGPTCSSATSMPIELGRRSTSSTNDGRRTPDALRPGPPRRLPAPLGGRQEGGVTLKLGLRGFVCRPAAVARCGVITMTNRRITVRCATRSRFIEAMSGARLRCAYLNAEESPGRGARRWRAGSPLGLPPAPPSPPPGGRSSPAGPTAARGRPSGAG